MYFTKTNGFKFLDFIRGTEEEICNYHPIAGSYAILQHDGKNLLCYNKFRKQWEIPAGKSEEHESPKECAVRELYEETGQLVYDLDFVGLLKVKNSTTQKTKYNPVYFSTVEKLQPFQENKETSEIILWDFMEQIGVIDEVDYYLLRYLKQLTGSAR